MCIFIHHVRVNVFQWCQYQLTKRAITAQRRRRPTLTLPPHIKTCPPRPHLCTPILPPSPLLPSIHLPTPIPPRSTLPAPTSPRPLLPPSCPPLVPVVWSWSALTVQTQHVVLGTTHLSWALAASAVELPLQTASRREVCHLLCQKKKSVQMN